MFAAEDRGEVPKGTAKRWAEHTKKKNLPEKVEKKALQSAVSQSASTADIPNSSAEQQLDATQSEKLGAVLGLKTAGGNRWARNLRKRMEAEGKNIPVWLSRLTGKKKEQ